MKFVITEVEVDYLENVQRIEARGPDGEQLRLSMPSAVDHNEVGDFIEVLEPPIQQG